jgi:hypothetical protein
MVGLILSATWLSRGLEALLARVEASRALIALRQCRAVAHFGLNSAIPQGGCGPLADIALVVGIGCAVSCRRPAEYLQCNFLNAIRIPTIKKAAIRLACNALGKHEIFSAPWCDLAHSGTKMGVASKYSRTDRKFD